MLVHVYGGADHLPEFMEKVRARIGLFIRLGLDVVSIVPIKANKEFNNYWIQKNRISRK